MKQTVLPAGVKDIKRSVLRQGKVGENVYVGPVVAVSPKPTPRIHMLFRETDVHGKDSIGKIIYRYSDDDGKTLSTGTEPDGLKRRIDKDGTIHAATMGLIYHSKTDTVLGIGVYSTYDKDEHMTSPYEDRAMAWSKLDVKTGKWSNWEQFEIPGAEFGKNPAFQPRPQFVELPDGNVLVPFQWCYKGDKDPAMSSGTALCSYDGKSLKPLKVGNTVTIPVKRGLYEPELCQFKNKFLMTLRADDGRGYLTVSDDGLNWQKPIPWRWENGKELEMGSTQTRLIPHGDSLLLVYTRKSPLSKNAFRYRAPLYCAQVNPKNYSLKEETEQVLFPNKGFSMGNFWVTDVSDTESWVTVGEWSRNQKKQAMSNLLARIIWK